MSRTMPLNTFWKGADVSFLDEIETRGGRYFDGGLPGDCLSILEANGINAIRLRVWNNPSSGFCNVERTLRMAKRVRELGLGLLIDFHYSDSWADPAKQFKPAAWNNLDYRALVRAVREFSLTVVQRLADQGTPPDMVQIGNEITYGMLWDEGRVYGPDVSDHESDWHRLAELFFAGVDGTRAVLGDAVNVMVHIDRGGDNRGSRFFLDNFLAQGVAFDTLGLSYYPWWHGPMDTLRANLSDLATTYQKDIILVETAYPWEDNEVLRGRQVDIPASPAEQANFLTSIIDIVESIPYGRGKGVYYWEPDSIPTNGNVHGWHKMGLFDSTGCALPGLRSFLR